MHTYNNLFLKNSRADKEQEHPLQSLVSQNNGSLINQSKRSS